MTRRFAGAPPFFVAHSVPLRTVLASLAAGVRADELLADFPTLAEADIQAAIAFAAASALEDIPPSPLPDVA